METSEDSSAHYKIQIMQLTSELRLLTEENLNLRNRLSAVWEEKEANEQTTRQIIEEIHRLRDKYEHIKKQTRADHVFAQSQELVTIKQTFNEQTQFLEKLSNTIARLLMTTHSLQSLPQNVTRMINEIVDLFWSDGFAEQKLIVALIRNGGKLSRRELQHKSNLGSNDFERALTSLLRSQILTNKGLEMIELTTFTSAKIPSGQWEKLQIPEIFQQVREVIISDEDDVSITNALINLRDTLFIKGITPRVGYQVEAGAREWRTACLTKQDLLNALSEWETQALG